MMKAGEYNQLSTEDKLVVLMKEGVRLEVWQKANNEMMVLYSICNFFVEMLYSMPNFSLRQIKALEKMSDWEGYLGNISLPRLE
jgi:hypothetical protein